MSEFKYVSRKEKKAMTMEELAEYQCNRRKYEYAKKIPIKGITWRKFANVLVVGALKIDRLVNREKITILKEQKRPVIYACTHIGGSDAERLVEAIGKPCYLFFGDPAPMYKDPTVNKLVFLKGSIDLETKDKEDRMIAFERGKELLSRGGSLLICPEGAWNVFENLPVMKLYSGTAQMAIEAGADIIPVAIEQFDKEFVIKIGQKIVTTKDMDYKILTTHLRDVLATLKYSIWETKPMQIRPKTPKIMLWDNVSVSKRVTLQREYSEVYRQSIIDKRTGYSVLSDIYKDMYHVPGETTADELIATIQDRLTLLRELKYELQRVDELLVDASGKIENLSAILSAHESFDYFASKVQKIFDTIGDKLTKIEAIIAILKDERDKDLKEDELDPLFYNQLCELNKRRNSLLAQIDDFGEIKEKRLALK